VSEFSDRLFWKRVNKKAKFAGKMFNLRNLTRLVVVSRHLVSENGVKQSLIQGVSRNVPQIATIQFVRNYAKGKDKKKDSKNAPKVTVNEEQLASVVNFNNLKGLMEKSVANMKDEFAKNLSLRSTTGAIDTLRVKADGKDYELQELGQIIRKNPKTIVINLIGFPQLIPNVLESLSKSGMNLNPQQDGTTVFIPVPKVTKEHREMLSKNAKAIFIKCRDAVKDVQNDFIKKVKKNGEISTDLNHQIQNQIVALGNTYIASAEKMLQVKQTELLAGKE
jgi:ribosome recycling factor